jgi:hypothetical protein
MGQLPRKLVSAFFVVFMAAQACTTNTVVITPSQSPSASASPTPAILDTDHDGQPDGQECRKQGEPFLTQLKEIDSRLSVGLTQTELNDHLGDARVAYDRMQTKQLPLNCLRALALLEGAFNAYVRSNNRWNNCITNFSCDVDSINPYLQAQWAIATRKIRQASASLAKLRSG